MRSRNSARKWQAKALSEAPFRSGQPLYMVTAWKAVPEVNGGSAVIVKESESEISTSSSYASKDIVLMSARV